MENVHTPAFAKHLLSEYDFEKFNYKKSYKIFIERILERGNLEDWKEMMKLYSKKQILETVEWSNQLKAKDKNFARLFINSDYFNVSQR